MRLKKLCLLVLLVMPLMACHSPAVKQACRNNHKYVGSKGWYTCYVKNHRYDDGVWMGTSHNRFAAKSCAFERCHRHSDRPANCYFSYCRLW